MAKYDPYVKCEKCDVMVRKSNKARHLKLKHGDTYKGRVFYEKITCFCSKRFSPNHLKTHWKKHHMDQVSLEHYRWEIKMRMMEAGRNFSDFLIELRLRRKASKKQRKLKTKKVKKQSNLLQLC